MKEKQKHREAFEKYAAAGGRRSLVKLAADLEVSESAVKQWSRAFRWADRLEARSREVAETLAKDSVQDEADERKKRQRIVDLALFKTAKALADDRIKPTMADVDRLLRLKREITAEGREREDMEFRVTWPQPGDETEDAAAAIEEARDAIREAVERREREDGQL